MSRNHEGLRAGDPHLHTHVVIANRAKASLAISAGANVKAVQRMLGHASAAMTLDRYGDLFDDDLESVATRLDGLREAARVARLLHEPIEGTGGAAAGNDDAPETPGL
jgi:hypothetical protein